MRSNLLIHVLVCLNFIVKWSQNILKNRYESGENNSVKHSQLYNSAIQILLEICLVAIIVLCEVVTTIEGA